MKGDDKRTVTWHNSPVQVHLLLNDRKWCLVPSAEPPPPTSCRRLSCFYCLQEAQEGSTRPMLLANISTTKSGVPLRLPRIHVTDRRVYKCICYFKMWPQILSLNIKIRRSSPFCRSSLTVNSKQEINRMMSAAPNDIIRTRWQLSQCPFIQSLIRTLSE